MKIAQISDIHYCEKYLDEVQKVMMFILGEIVDHKPDIIVLGGDLFEHRLDQNSKSFLAAVDMVYALATEAPVLILQGTFSHDAPGALEVFNSVGSDITHAIHVSNRIQQVIYDSDRAQFFESENWAFDVVPEGRSILFSCLPAINKGHVAAAVGAENAAEAVGDHVADLLKAWSSTHLALRKAGIPTAVVTHGTVSGSINESGVPMAGLDHEYTTGTLFAAEASAVMLGHIHKHQVWEKEGRLIAYPGSVGRLHFGEVDPKGFILWDITSGGSSFEFIETPAKRLVEVEFTGTPDMDELRTIAADAEGAHVRVRFAVDEEHKNSVDKDAIKEIFGDAAEIKIEGKINPIQRQRAAGIGTTVSNAEKLEKWCELTSSDPTPLLERLEILESFEPDAIVEQLS